MGTENERASVLHAGTEAQLCLEGFLPFCCYFTSFLLKLLNVENRKMEERKRGEKMHRCGFQKP